MLSYPAICMDKNSRSHSSPSPKTYNLSTHKLGTQGMGKNSWNHWTVLQILVRNLSLHRPHCQTISWVWQKLELNPPIRIRTLSSIQWYLLSVFSKPSCTQHVSKRPEGVWTTVQLQQPWTANSIQHEVLSSARSWIWHSATNDVTKFHSNHG